MIIAYSVDQRDSHGTAAYAGLEPDASWLTLSDRMLIRGEGFLHNPMNLALAPSTAIGRKRYRGT